MQPLELPPPAPVSTNNIDSAPSRDLPGEPAPDGEFGRLMERAMAPDEKSKAHPDHLPRKGNLTGTARKTHAAKSQQVDDSKATDAVNNLENAGNNVKAKSAACPTDESTTSAKESNTTDLTATISTPADESSLPLPIFLSLPLLERPEAGNAGAENAVLANDFSTAQPAPVIDAVKALPTIASNLAVAGVGTNPGTVLAFQKYQPEKSVTIDTVDKSGTDVLLPGEKAPQPAIDAKAILPSPSETSTPLESSKVERPVTAPVIDTTPMEPIRVEEPAVAQLEHKTANLAASAPDQTDDKLQTAPLASQPVESMKNDGTGVAITASSMKNSDKTNKVAGLDVQVLPGGTNGTSRETVLPAHATVSAVRSSEKANQDFNLPLPSANPAPMDTIETANIVALPSLTDARMRDVERTHDLVSINALRMVESKSDSLQVVIKPGAGTELSLELRHRNGIVEAEAVLQRGDYQLMNQHWPELQAKLEQRGIKLAPLGSETSFSTADNGNAGTGNFSRQQSSREEAAQQASAFAEFTVAMSRGGATARLAPAIAGGWESWA